MPWSRPWRDRATHTDRPGSWLGIDGRLNREVRKMANESRTGLFLQGTPDLEATQQTATLGDSPRAAARPSELWLAKLFVLVGG
jgi:hypothetical protein